MEKRPFFQPDMAGLGKYCMGGYGRIGVKVHCSVHLDSCATILSKGNCSIKYLYRLIPYITLSQSECSLMSHDLMLSIQILFKKIFQCEFKINILNILQYV